MHPTAPVALPAYALLVVKASLAWRAGVRARRRHALFSPDGLYFKVETI
jgi:hypothetical protein